MSEKRLLQRLFGAGYALTFCVRLTNLEVYSGHFTTLYSLFSKSMTSTWSTGPEVTKATKECTFPASMWPKGLLANNYPIGHLGN